MKVAIDVSPLESGHKVRGVGFYLQNLKESLLHYFPENEYIFFTNKLQQKVDIVHYPYFDPFFLTLPFHKQNKTVVTVHDLTPLVFPENFPSGIKGSLRWQIQKRNLKRVDGVIADSLSSKKDIEKIAGIASQKISVAYLAASETFHVIENKDSIKRELTKKYNLPKEFVLYVGDITWNKNLVRLVKACQKIDTKLVMVGKALVDEDFDRNNPWNKEQVEFQRLTQGDESILKLGFLPTEDIVGLYNIATVFAMPSVYEGFGLPVVEAMQCGCPVVTTKGGSLPEVAGDAVEYVDGYSIDSMAAGIKKVISNNKLSAELSAKGLKQAKKFNWRKTAEDTIAVYKKVLTQI
jgi:glycosyltransferase involved in cell wall biosynthesis